MARLPSVVKNYLKRRVSFDPPTGSGHLQLPDRPCPHLQAASPVTFPAFFHFENVAGIPANRLSGERFAIALLLSRKGPSKRMSAKRGGTQAPRAVYLDSRSG